jgi:hypothetical protein
MVFDAIGFVYPDYHYRLRGQEKKMKVLTDRPRYFEPTVVPKFGAGTSSAAESKQAAPIVQSAEEPTIVPKVPTVGLAEVKDDKAAEPHVEK